MKANGRNLQRSSDSNDQCCTCLDCWLLNLAQEIQLRVSRISEEASERILDIWRMGSVIESKEFEDVLPTPQKLTGEEGEMWGREGGLSKETFKQHFVMNFLCHYMDVMASSPSSMSSCETAVVHGNCDDNTSEASRLTHSERVRNHEQQGASEEDTTAVLSLLTKLFHAVDLPLTKYYVSAPSSSVKNSSSLSSHSAKVLSRFQQCQRNCLILAQDPNMLAVVSGMFAAANAPAHNAKGVVSAANVSELAAQCVSRQSRVKVMTLARREYHALLMAKVLHGLGSALLPAADWRERCAAHWESCRDLSFTAVQACALQTVLPG